MKGIGWTPYSAVCASTPMTGKKEKKKGKTRQKQTMKQPYAVSLCLRVCSGGCLVWLQKKLGRGCCVVFVTVVDFVRVTSCTREEKKNEP